MLILYGHKKAGFTELQKLLEITPGKLDHHIRKLEENDFVKTEKTIFSSRPLTFIRITRHGEDSFKDYADKLRKALKKVV